MWKLVLGMMLALAAPAATRGVDDPLAFVTAAYATYRSAPNRPPPDATFAYSRRLRGLFAAYEAWARAHDDLVGSLDFDWWMNAQDWTISDIQVSQLDPAPGRRVIVARWKNYDRADSSRFAFVRWRGRWYLDDVINGSGHGDDGWTLSALLRERP